MSETDEKPEAKFGGVFEKLAREAVEAPVAPSRALFTAYRDIKEWTPDQVKEKTAELKSRLDEAAQGFAESGQRIERIISETSMPDELKSRFAAAAEQITSVTTECRAAATELSLYLETGDSMHLRRAGEILKMFNI